MSFRNLDGSGDWTFGAGFSNYATGLNEIALNIQTRVLSFYRDCFFDLEAGIDYFNLLDYNTQQKLENEIQKTIISTDGVFGINSINLYLNSNRKLMLEYSVKTIYSDTLSREIEIVKNKI